MNDIQISKAIIRRLPRYHRFLGELKEQGVARISSQELSKLMKVTASQIRQDLNHFGGFGQQGYGYKVDYLYDEIGRIMGIGTRRHLILVGAGNLGKALANYTNYRNRGFCIEAIFDKDTNKIGTIIHGMTVLDIAELPEYLSKHHVDIATIAIPKEQAVKVVPTIVAGGVKAIWNFAHTDLDVPSDVAVENVHLSESLMNLSYRLLNQDKETE